MPPPKQAKSTATANPSDASAVENRTAAERVYGIAELKARIFALLEKKHLAKMMRVDKKSQMDVARWLYGVVDYAMLKKSMATKSSPLSKYLPVVSTVIAQNITLTLAEQRACGVEDIARNFKGAGSKKHHTEWLQSYHPDVHAYIIATIRSLCPRVHTIIFGREKYAPLSVGHEQFVVRCNTASMRNDGGEVYRTYAVSFALHDPPPASIPDPRPPNHRYEMQGKYDLSLTRANDGQLSRDGEWLVALRTSPLFHDLYKAVKFGHLPVTMDDVKDLVLRNRDYRFPDARLQYITANVLPWEPSDLLALAGVASNLTTLKLATTFVDDNVSLSFADLPSIISVVRTGLPRLTTFHLSLKGVEGADAICLPQLTATCLSESGSVKNLIIHTEMLSSSWNKPRFNILRILFRICHRSLTRVYIGALADFQSSIYDDGSTSGMKTLQQVPPNAKRFLSTVDFSSLGIVTAEHLASLKYDSTGRPIGRWDSMAAKWDGHAKSVEEAALHTALPALEAGVKEYSDISGRLKDIFSSGADVDKVSEAEKLLDALKRMKKAAAEAAKLLHVDPELQGEIWEFIRSAKKSGAAREATSGDSGVESGPLSS